MFEFLDFDVLAQDVLLFNSGLWSRQFGSSSADKVLVDALLWRQFKSRSDRSTGWFLDDVDVRAEELFPLINFLLDDECWLEEVFDSVFLPGFLLLLCEAEAVPLRQLPTSLEAGDIDIAEFGLTWPLAPSESCKVLGGKW